MKRVNVCMKIFRGRERLIVWYYLKSSNMIGSKYKCISHIMSRTWLSEHQWCSGNINAFQAFALGSIPGWCNPFLCHCKIIRFQYRISINYTREPFFFIMLIKRMQDVIGTGFLDLNILYAVMPNFGTD